MECAIEEFSLAQLKEMSDRQVQERMAYLQEIEERIRQEQDVCQERLGIKKPQRPTPEKCELCGSTNLDPRVKGGYFCKKCGYRAGAVV